MKGSITYMKDRKYFAVNWYDPELKHTIKITYNHRGKRMYTEKDADTLLALMRSDVERGIFRLDRYTREVPVDTVAYLREWLTIVSPTLKPATLKDYTNSIEKYLIPFFEEHECQLHEIKLDVLTMLLNAIPRAGKGKLNVMYCLHACLDFAWRSQRIPIMPPFPRRKQYQIKEPEILWLPENRQLSVIDVIPEIHRPIFMWCKLHYRRPGEAMALFREDFDGEIFTVQRTFSARRLTHTTKTGEVHKIPCHEDFKRYFDLVTQNRIRANYVSPFYFVNPTGRLEGKPYTHTFMSRLWNEACRKMGENIKMYQGLKHSSCSQFLNEKGGTLSELQEVTDHARFESVKKYAKTEVARRKTLMEKRVVNLSRVSDTSG